MRVSVQIDNEYPLVWIFLRVWVLDIDNPATRFNSLHDFFKCDPSVPRKNLILLHTPSKNLHWQKVGHQRDNVNPPQF